jgi:hypothetical protein
VKFSADWIENAQNAAPEERVTVANFRVWLAEQNVTMNLRDSVSADHIVVSLYSLAEGLAHDWWSLFGSREREISLIKHRSGYAMPDIRFRFDGMGFEAAAIQKVYQNPSLRFWAGPCEVLTREEAEASLSGFVELVLARLESKGQGNTSAALRWSRVQASRSDFQESVFCESAGALGLDPYAIGEAESAIIEEAASLFQKESLAEFLSGAKNYQPHSLLNWVRVAEKRPKYKSCLSDLMPLVRKAVRLAPERQGERGWALGYRRARSLREALNLRQNDRIRNDKTFAKKLGAATNFEAAARVDGIRALRSHTTTDDVSIHMRDHGTSPQARVAQLFSFARAVGDVACFPSPTRSPVNELHSAHRQAAGRAFAAEFLAPIDEVLSMQADGHDPVTIADEFSVSTTMIERQIENMQRIKLACA